MLAQLRAAEHANRARTFRPSRICLVTFFTSWSTWRLMVESPAPHSELRMPRTLRSVHGAHVWRAMGSEGRCAPSHSLALETCSYTCLIRTCRRELMMAHHLSPRSALHRAQVCDALRDIRRLGHVGVPSARDVAGAGWPVVADAAAAGDSA